MTDIFKDGLGEHTTQHNVCGTPKLTPYEIQTLYAAFLSKLLEETDLRIWPNRHLDCQGVTGEKGKTET